MECVGASTIRSVDDKQWRTQTRARGERVWHRRKLETEPRGADCALEPLIHSRVDPFGNPLSDTKGVINLGLNPHQQSPLPDVGTILEIPFGKVQS